MSRSVSFAELREASAEERERLLGDIIEGARGPANGKVGELDAQIAEYERFYEMPTSEMLEKVHSGEMVETEDIAYWMMKVNVRKRLHHT